METIHVACPGVSGTGVVIECADQHEAEEVLRSLDPAYGTPAIISAEEADSDEFASDERLTAREALAP